MSNQAHILVVEDEEHLAIGIRYNLEAEGFEVTTVGDGPHALDLLSKATPTIDLIILDLMLPGMSGYDVCESIRESGLQLPILMLSARSLPEDRARGFDVGADQYLNKPFELDELISRVKSLLQRFSQRQRPDGDIRFDPKVTVNGRSVDLDTYQITGTDADTDSSRLTALEMKLLR